MILTNARILTFDAANRVLDSRQRRDPAPTAPSARWASGRARGRGDRRCRRPAADARAHQLPHASVQHAGARHRRCPARRPRNFPEILKKLWWRLDRALNPEDIYYSALVGLIDSAKCGVGTVIDHHSSPNACAGSLDRIEQAFREVGLRGATVLRNQRPQWPGTARRRAFAKTSASSSEPRAGDGMVGAAFGLHAAFTLGDRTLRACAEANQSLGAGFHIHVAEDRCDAGAVTPPARARHARTSARWRRTASTSPPPRWTALARRRRERGPQSAIQLQQRRGHGEAAGAGARAACWWAWAPTATRRACGTNSRPPSTCRNCAPATRAWPTRKPTRPRSRTTARSCSKIWGMDVGRIETGAQADLILVDYFPPTPLEPRQPVRPPAVRHLQRARGFADGERPLRGARRQLRHRGRARSRRKGRRAGARALWKRF